MNNLLGYIKKYGIQTVVTVISVDGYRRQVKNDILNQAIMNKNINQETTATNEELIGEFRREFRKLSREEANRQIEALETYLKNVYNITLDKIQLDMDKQNFNEDKNLFYKEKESIEAERVGDSNLKIYKEAWDRSEEKEKSIAAYNDNKSEENKIEMDKSIQKFESIKKELDEIRKSDIGEVFRVAYYKYYEFLDTLSPDKIVCLFNIFIGSMTLSSFGTVLSIMLSENIINRISFLDKYPRILKLLKLRNNINRKISKFYLLTHVVVILGGILGNIYMFCL